MQSRRAKTCMQCKSRCLQDMVTLLARSRAPYFILFILLICWWAFPGLAAEFLDWTIITENKVASCELAWHNLVVFLFSEQACTHMVRSFQQTMHDKRHHCSCLLLLIWLPGGLWTVISGFLIIDLIFHSVLISNSDCFLQISVASEEPFLKILWDAFNQNVSRQMAVDPAKLLMLVGMYNLLFQILLWKLAFTHSCALSKI